MNAEIADLAKVFDKASDELVKTSVEYLKSCLENPYYAESLIRNGTRSEADRQSFIVLCLMGALTLLDYRKSQSYTRN